MWAPGQPSHLAEAEKQVRWAREYRLRTKADAETTEYVREVAEEAYREALVELDQIPVALTAVHPL